MVRETDKEPKGEQVYSITSASSGHSDDLGARQRAADGAELVRRLGRHGRRRQREADGRDGAETVAGAGFPRRRPQPTPCAAPPRDSTRECTAPRTRDPARRPRPTERVRSVSRVRLR